MASQSHFAVVTTPESHDVVGQPPRQKPSIGEYLRSRVTTLKPPMTKVENPFTLLSQLNKLQWMNFGVAFAAWCWDAFDFFTVSMTLEDLSETFHKSKTDVTWGISVTLMFRSVGAIIFGILADRYGRKWPFIVNNIMFIIFELATGFCQTYTQFMWVRAFFGIAMGGIWGNVTAMALEDAPAAARGILSGMLQQGYAMGYLLAVVFSRALVNTTSHGWRPLFWFGACPPVLIILARLSLPETAVFRERQRLREATTNATGAFLEEGKVVLKRKWLLLGYLVLLMTGMNFMSHGSQDLYPTMLKNTLEFNSNKVTVTQVVANLGAITGGTLVGYYSQVFGRRLSILAMVVIGAALLYPYTYTRGETILVPAFFFQFCVQGAWGVIPIHLMELAPPKYSTFVAGTAYQLGNLISSTASTIESSLGEHYPLPPTRKGVSRYDYSKVICVLLAVVFAYLFVMVFLGPEKRGQEFDAAHDDINEEIQYNELEKESGFRDQDKEKVAHPV